VKPVLLDTGVIVAEACYLTRELRAALENVRTGVFQIPLQHSRSAGAMQRILRKYRDRKVDLADACLVHLATELGVGSILTFDRDFIVYRWGANRPFHFLLPF
jgi:predicted nucleic acid-binding protein